MLETQTNKTGPTSKTTPTQYKKGDKHISAYNYIKNAIITNSYKPQQLINERELGEALPDISRTPIREALKRLIYEGLIENIAGKGMVVTQVRFKDLLEINEMRIPLECTAIRLFIERADDVFLNYLENILEKHESCYKKGDLIHAIEYDNAFHYTIGEGTMNTRLYTTIQQIIEESTRGAFLTQYDSKRIKTSIQKHHEIFDAIRSRDIDLAIQVLTEHLQGWISYIHELQIKNYFLFDQ
jgi:DNA-binding GntR family transcriptional regulator